MLTSCRKTLVLARSNGGKSLTAHELRFYWAEVLGWDMFLVPLDYLPTVGYQT